MKTVITNTSKRIIRLTAVFLMAIATPIFSYAQEFPGDLRLLTTTEKGQPVFQLNLYNSDSEKYYLDVKDGLGNVLYSETLKGVNLTAKYMLDIDEADFNAESFELRFEVTSVKTRQKQVYSVKRNDIIVKNLAIAKL